MLRDAAACFRALPLRALSGSHIAVFALLLFTNSLPVAAVEVTSLTLTGDPADFVGEGLDYSYTPLDATFEVMRFDPYTVHVFVLSLDFSDFWTLIFAAPNGQPLAPGFYPGATDYPDQAPEEPGLSVDGMSRGCGSSTGSFEVLEITYGPEREILSFRAKFEQHCGFSLAALRGEIRFRAQVHAEVHAPERLAVLAVKPMAFDVAGEALDGTTVTLAAADLPEGATFVDLGDGRGRFTWTPVLSQIGPHTVVFSARDSLGRGENTKTEISVGRIMHVPAEHPTIQGAIQSAIAGSHVVVAPGTYFENIDFLGKALTVESEAGPQATIIDGGARDAVVILARLEGRDSVLSGFTIRNGWNEARAPYFLDGGGISIDGSSPSIRDCVITGNYACWGGGINVDFGSPLIVGNTISGNRAGCGAGGGGISIGGAAKAEVRDNLIQDNTTSSTGGGILLFAAGTPLIQGNDIRGNRAQEGGGISMYNYSDAEITGNIISGNSADRGGGVFWLVMRDRRGPRLVGNTIAGNDSVEGSAVAADGFDAAAELIDNLLIAKSGQQALWCGEFYDPRPPLLRHNDVYGRDAAPYGEFCGGDATGFDGNISVDPAFNCPEIGDFRPVAGSPVIDAGENDLSVLPLLDFQGRPRILDGDGDETAWVDMGAFEFDPTAPPADPCVYAFCPADLQVDAPRGQTAAIVDYPLPAAPTTATVTCTPPPGSTFHEGTTPVTCTAALTSGDTATCEFAVTVVVRPLNDLITNATVISALPFTDRVDTRNATAGLEPYCSGEAPAVWYTYTPAEDLILTLDSAGSTYDVQLSVYHLFGGYYSGGAICGRGPFTFFVKRGIPMWIGARATNQAGDLVLNLSGRVPLSLAVGIDPSGSRDRRTGAATLTGTATCSHPATVRLTGEVSFRRSGLSATRSFRVEFACDGTTPWEATLPATDKRTVGVRATVKISARADDLSTGDTANAQTSGYVQLEPLRDVSRIRTRASPSKRSR